MILVDTEVEGAFLVDVERHTDERGFFARTWCEEDFEALGLVAKLDQVSLSFNARRGTLRGMHYQRPPHEETKVVRCTMGSMYDVVLDLRPNSPTYLAWHGGVLSSENRRSFYIPGGCAHGFITLEDATEVLYMISDPFVPDAATGVRWNDPAFGIDWPEPVQVISPRDRDYPDFGTDVAQG